MFGGEGWFKKHHRGRHFGARPFERGDLKYVILELLAQKASHGYEIIHALEERFSGFYAPSPGAVYPTLQLLEDMGYVTSTERDGKRVYQVTPEGQRFLKERGDVVDGIHERLSAWWDRQPKEEARDILNDLTAVGARLVREAHTGGLSQEKLRTVREIVSGARSEIEKILGSEKKS